jgi:DTW domain-containing protein YfiP
MCEEWAMSSPRDRRSGRPRRHSGRALAPRLADFPGAICAWCGKPESLCVCAEIVPVENRVAVLILQHPQEQDKVLGSAGLAARHFATAALRVGLSWPSLAKALGPLAERVTSADPRAWATLHLGAARTDALPPGRDIAALDGKGHPLPNQDAALKGIAGIVLFDGTWSQAKTLWWRNPWVLKTRRLVLAPARPSRYGALRREPRDEGLSTLEAAALAVARLEGKPEVEATLIAGFERMLAKYRAALRARKMAQPAPT